jgi:large subunit ribosomal protein L2
MFLNYYKFIKFNYKSSATRKSSYYFNLFNIQKKIKQLAIYKKWNAGKNDSGRIILRTKGRKFKKLRYNKINYYFNYNRLAFIYTFQFWPFKNKLISVIFFANGAITQVLTTTIHRLFRFFMLTFSKNIRKYLPRTYFQYLGKIAKLSQVSVLTPNPIFNPKYCRSAGVSGRIILKDTHHRIVSIQLSSKSKKIFSFYSFTAYGKLIGWENKKFSNTKFGYWRNFGIKPIVRGVAKNPVDHPHGGRTKAIKHQKTPWGFTTKYK